MNGVIKCKIPEELKHPLFFLEEEAELSQERTQEWSFPSSAPYFAYELLYWNGFDCYHPWKCPDKRITALFERWAVIKEKARMIFAERRAPEAKEFMIEGLSLFFSVLFWMHNQPVDLRSWKEHVRGFQFIPVNTEERVSFILSRPAFYHSYVQLGELFVELEKQYYKRVSKKASKQ